MSTPTVTAPPAAPPPPSAPAPAPSVPAKARPGELRAQVAQILSANHGTGYTVTTLVGLLGNSGGAIGNACQTLVARGEAQLQAAKPRTYGATASTAAAAQKAVITPPHPRPTAPPSQGTATPAPATPARRGRPVPIVRPNGQTYHPRALADIPDVEALQRLRTANVPALLYGPPGTGKTSVIEAAFPDLLTIAGDGDTTVGDLLGEYTQNEAGGYEFIYGPVVTAMQEGRALLIDDATLISPKVLAALYPAMDGRKQIIVKAHKGETITAAEGFYVIAGHNPGVHGAILTEALSSRFSMQIQVGSDYDLAATLKIDGKAVRIARNLATKAESGEIGWAPQLRELISFQKISDVLGAPAAFANLVGIAPLEDRDTVAEVVKAVTGKAVTALALGRQL
jgi:nitric oxide reductase NorQ protein